MKNISQVLMTKLTSKVCLMHTQSNKNKFELMEDFLDGLEPEELRHLVKDAYAGDEEAFLDKFSPDWREELQAMNTKRYAQADKSGDLKNRLIDYIYEESDEFGMELMKFEEKVFPKVRDNTYTKEQIARMLMPLVFAAAKSFEEYYKTDAFDITTLNKVIDYITEYIIMTTRPGMINASTTKGCAFHLKQAIKILSQQMKSEIIEGDWVEVSGPKGVEFVNLKSVNEDDVLKIYKKLLYSTSAYGGVPVKGTTLEGILLNKYVLEIMLHRNWFGVRTSTVTHPLVKALANGAEWIAFPVEEEAEEFLKEEQMIGEKEE